MNDSKLAVITGGQGALGLAVAESLEAAEMRVLAPCRQELDVTCATSVSDFFKPIDRLDLLVCNAGVIDDMMLAKMPEESWDRVMEVNLKGAFLTARAASKIMMKQRLGHIIFVSSFSAFHPPFGQANYAAAKSALVGLAKSLARELGGRKIRVNVIVPGFMETKMTQELSGGVIANVREKHCMSEFNTPQCVAEFISCLHTKMPHTSGQVFNLDSRII